MPSSALDDMGFGDPNATAAASATASPTGGRDVSGGYHISRPPPPLPNEPDASLLARAAIAEAGANPAGQRAVMGALLQRQALSGKSISDLLQEPGAIQTYWNGTIQSIDPSSPAFQSALKVAQTAQPTPGRDSWYSPAGVRAQGFGKPPFDPATGTMIGGQLFGSGYAPHGRAASALDDLGFADGPSPAGAGAAAKPPAAPGPIADVPVLDRVAADLARHQMAQNQAADKPQWPVYDETNDVWRNSDGSIAMVGGKPVPERRGPGGELEVTVNGTSSPRVINDWMTAHPADPSNEAANKFGVQGASTSLNRGSSGLLQGLENVGHSIEGGDLAVRSSPLGMLLPNNGSIADWERADQARGVLQRNANDLQFANSGAYDLGKFGGEVVGTLPAMLATDGLAGAGMTALRGTEVGGDLLSTAPNANLLLRAPMTLAKSAGRGAFYGGEAGALTSAGSNAPIGDQILSGAGQGAVLNPLLGGVGGAMKAVGKFVSPIIDASTAGGREAVLDRNLLGATGGKLAADLNEYVPGSRPTLAQATQNPTLAVTERTLKSSNNHAANSFAALDDANDAARENFVSALQSDAPAVDRLRAAREAATSDLRNAAFAAKTPTDSTPVVQAIDEILASPAGQRDAVAKNLGKIRAKLVTPVDMGGPTPVLRPQTDAEQLYGVRQAIGDQLSPLSEDRDARLAKAQLLQVQGALDSVIEKGAPGFKGYLRAYSQASRPIDALEYLQSMNLRAPKGNLTLAKVNQAVTRMEADRAEPGINPAKSLSDDQVQALYNLRNDLRRADTTRPLAQAARSPTVTGNLDNEGVVHNLLSPIAAAGLGLVSSAHPVGAGAVLLGKIARESQKAKIGNLLIDRLLNPDETRAPLNVPTVAPKGAKIGWRSPFLAGAGTEAARRPMGSNKLMTGTSPLQ